ncbi:MAG: hypothetical protein QNJ49_11870 [Mastigocoleus sp. MO_167.B18]|nr:hypothetical protein [Mastigocoleus sp. MO_167.B18]
MFHNTMLQQVKRKTLPETLVQLADGRTIGVSATGNLERNQPTIRRFVGEAMTLMLTSSKNLPPSLIKEIASPLLSEDFSQKLNSKNNNIDFNYGLDRNSRNTEHVLAIAKISQPEEISKGKWKVDIYANHLTFKGTEKTGTSVPFNKQIFVRAIEKSKLTPNQSGIPANLAISALQEARLEIYNICELKDKKCSTNKKIKSK